MTITLEGALDWNDLRYLLVLRDCGNIAGAARRLKVDQATVRRRLATLQKAAGVALVVKVPGGLELTLAGEQAVEVARVMDASASQLEASLAALDTSLAGAVRIAAPDTIATWILAPALGDLRALHPELTVELVAGAQAVSMVRREAEVALRLFRPREESLAARRLATMGFGLYASRAYVEPHRPDAQALAGQILLGYDDSLLATRHGRWFAERASGKLFLRTNSTFALHQAAVAGLGIALLPCFVGDPEPALVRVAGPTEIPASELWLVLHPDLRRVRRVRAVASFVEAVIARNAALLSGAAQKP
jgi:DNA-binding transcriptional LysR family regulator